MTATTHLISVLIRCNDILRIEGPAIYPLPENTLPDLSIPLLLQNAGSPIRLRLCAHAVSVRCSKLRRRYQKRPSTHPARKRLELLRLQRVHLLQCVLAHVLELCRDDSDADLACTLMHPFLHDCGEEQPWSTLHRRRVRVLLTRREQDAVPSIVAAHHRAVHVAIEPPSERLALSRRREKLLADNTVVERLDGREPRCYGRNGGGHAGPPGGLRKRR